MTVHLGGMQITTIPTLFAALDWNDERADLLLRHTHLGTKVCVRTLRVHDGLATTLAPLRYASVALVGDHEPIDVRYCCDYDEALANHDALVERAQAWLRHAVNSVLRETDLADGRTVLTTRETGFGPDHRPADDYCTSLHLVRPDEQTLEPSQLRLQLTFASAEDALRHHDQLVAQAGRARTQRLPHTTLLGAIAAEADAVTEVPVGPHAPDVHQDAVVATSVGGPQSHTVIVQIKAASDLTEKGGKNAPRQGKALQA